MLEAATPTPSSSAATHEPWPRLLFVPVSGPYGMGEYARSVAIARAARSRWPAADIRFMLSRDAPYAADAPFEAVLLPSSATFHSSAVIEELMRFRPHAAVFDNAGRTAQLRAARRIAARIIYISARSRQRGKAFRLSWMRIIDEHWIAYPRFIAGNLTPLERLKLRLLRRPAVRYLDVIMPRSEPAHKDPTAAAGGYVLFVPGGGTGHPGARDAVGQFMGAARILAMDGIESVFVGRAEHRGAEASPLERLRCMGPLPQEELVALMRGARIVIANGGSTLLQAIASGCASIGVPIAGDQKQRIDACSAAGVARASELSVAGMAAAARFLLDREHERAALASRAVQLGLTDGVAVAVQSLGSLLDPR